MFKVLRTNDGMFQVKTKEYITTTMSIHQLMRALRDLAVSWDEIEYAITELVNNDHHEADFGINRTFIFSK